MPLTPAEKAARRAQAALEEGRRLHARNRQNDNKAQFEGMRAAFQVEKAKQVVHAASAAEHGANITVANVVRERAQRSFTKHRFLNMHPEQVQMRKGRQWKIVWRARKRTDNKITTKQKKDSVATELTHQKRTPNKRRPCWGKVEKTAHTSRRAA